MLNFSLGFPAQRVYRAAGVLITIGFWLITQYAIAEHQIVEVNDMQFDTEQRAEIIRKISFKLVINFDEGLKELKHYNDSKSEDLGRDLLALLWRYALDSSVVHVRQEIVVHFLDVAHSDNKFLAEQALSFLLYFTQDDFNKLANQHLKSFSYFEEYTNTIIRVIGIANLHSESPRLQQIVDAYALNLSPDAYYSSREWAALLALARFGNENSISQVIEQVKTEQDIVTRSTKLFADLGYTQQPLALDYLRDYLRSRERLPQIKETVPGRLEALYAAEVLCNLTEKFPLTNCDIQERDLPVIIQWSDKQEIWNIRK